MADIKADPTYVPAKNPGSRRWHARTSYGEFEILTTGHKWYDTRAKKGGGGAIDLAMHVLELCRSQMRSRFSTEKCRRVLE